jgi:hypothetical protein
MMVRADAIGAKYQESPGEHETENHPHSLIDDLFNNRKLKTLLGGSRSTPGIQ